MVEIIWCKSIEPQNKIEIEKYLNPYLWLVPKWCQTLWISLYNQDGDAAISTLVSYEYRRAEINFYTSWLNAAPETKQDNVVHECCHLFVNELYHQARRVVLATCEDEPKLKDFAFNELSKTVECVTQDLTFAILNKSKENQ